LTSTALTVFYTVAGTASNGVDYTSLPGSVVISNGQTTATIKVAPIADGVEEGSESVELFLASAGTYTVGVPSSGTIAILDWLPFYAVRNGRFNASDADTWGQGLGIYPASAGDVANISGWTVTASNVGEVLAGVVVNVSGSGSSTGVLWLADPGPASFVMSGVTVNVNSGGVYRIVTDNNVSNSTTVLNGGTLAFAGGSFGATSIININSDSLITPVSSAACTVLGVANGTGKLTLTADAGNDGIKFAAASTWSGAWDFQGNMRFNPPQQRSYPGDVRVASGKTMSIVGGLMIKGTRSGFGSNTFYLANAMTIGDGSGNGKLSPGDIGVNGGIGAITVMSYGTPYSSTLAFSSNSLYAVDITGTSAYDRVTVIGTGSGTGKVTIAENVKLNVTLWTPSESVLLDVPVIDTTGGGGGLLTGAFSTVTWSNAAGWSNLAVTAIDNDLHITGLYTAPAGNPDSNSNSIPDEWELQVFGNLTNSATGDNDGDGLDNFGEWVAGTHPTNGTSVFRFTNLVQNVGVGMVLRWSSESNRYYTLRLSTNLLLDPFSGVLTNRMPANPPMNVHTDAVTRPGAFYQVIVTNQ
jgi:hypothetical protein